MVAYSDILGRVIREETEGFDGTPVYIDTTHDALGNITAKSRPYFSGDTVYWHTFTHDILGRVITATAPDSSVTTTAYNGLSTSVTNALNQTNKQITNARDELAQVIDADSNVTDYRYDPFGNLVEVEDTLGNITSNTYDIRGRKVAMSDPDMGDWTYSYNVLGELVSQTDAKSQTVTMSYDLLGRMVSRTEPEGTSTWTYDTATTGIGKLHTNSGSGGDTQTISYDSLGRPAATTTTYDSHTFTISQTYDSQGRVDTLTYPASPHYPLGLDVKNTYNARGYLATVENVSTSLVYWQADAMNAEGQLTHHSLGNGITTQHAYTPETGLVNGIGSSTPLGTLDVQDLSYTFDTLGNLTLRQDLQQGLSETFVYDVLNRMTSSILDDGSTQTTKNYSYNAIGNLLSKTGIGSYTYGENGSGVHAVTTAGGKSITYDTNGNMTSSWNFTAVQSRSISWTSYNKPGQIAQGSDTVDFNYDINRDLIKQVATTASGSSTRYYIGGLYERDESGSLTTHIHYIKAAGQIVALYKSKSDDTEQTRYLHRDHLGSITEITDESAGTVEQLSYDPHGKRRNIDWSDALAQITGFETKRSFTGHLYVDDVGIINMGGRFYDPDLGRFLSPDPIVQEPGNAQNLNRYSYVLNNPLSYTDPSGFFFDKIFKAISKVFKAVANFIKDNIRTIFAIGFAVIGAYVGCVACGGFASGLISSGGDLKSGIIGAVTAQAFYEIGTAFGEVASFAEQAIKSVAHGIVGGVSSAIQGGDFFSGFLSAGVTQAFAPGIDGIDAGNIGISIPRTIAAAVVGGTASVLGGGKFKNGAITGSFSRLFNDDLHKLRLTRRGMRPLDHQDRVLSKEEQQIRINQLFNTFTGTATTISGAILCTTLAGCIIGGPLMVLGANDYYEAYSGNVSGFEAFSDFAFDNPEIGKGLDFATDFAGVKSILHGPLKLIGQPNIPHKIEGIIDTISGSASINYTKNGIREFNNSQ